MKRGKLVSALVALVSLAVVLAITWVDLGRTSPGPLSPTHAQDPELVGKSGCVLCHGDLLGSMADACSTCHEGVDADIELGTGLHGTLADTAQVERCADCHVEHLGDGVPLVTTRSFALAGVPDPDAYDHAAFDFRLEGRHAELGCEGCHANAEVDVLPVGEPRFRGLDQSCDSCHEDVHDGRMARACADCHGQSHPFDEVWTFEHAQPVIDVGAHADLACAACHEAGSPYSVGALAGAAPTAGERACADCHESPHDAAFLTEVAGLAGVARGAECEACHDPAHPAFELEALADAPVGGAGLARLHAASGFPLTPPHAEVGCERCHAAEPRLGFEDRFRGRGPDDCGTCHADPHAGQFGAAAARADGCLDCHQRHAFAPSAFDVAQHAGTGFPLEGAHAAVACAACHPHDGIGPAGARVFRGTASSCASCHADAHRGRLAADVAGDCARCHGVDRFTGVGPGFEHDVHTAFRLQGAHASLACDACHARSTRPDANGRRLGFAHEVFESAASACADCHADPHEGRFESGRAASRAQGCATCHTTGAWTEVDAQAFDHARWTGYPLVREHATADCAACHSVPRGDGRRLGLVPGSSCADCHADPHLGQFVEAGQQDCARCHSDELELVFDHDRHSRFPLDATHRVLECAACHPPWPTADGDRAVRYKPLGVTCTECHGPEVPR